VINEIALDCSEPYILGSTAIAQQSCRFRTHTMPRVAPATRIDLVEALSGLQRLQREMVRSPQRDEFYKSEKRALQAAIHDLKKWLSADASYPRGH